MCTASVGDGNAPSVVETTNREIEVRTLPDDSYGYALLVGRRPG